MKIFLDTSYLFPYIGIDLVESKKKRWTLHDLVDLTEKPIDILYSDISLFELYTKVLKISISSNNEINLDEIHANILTLSQSSRFQQILYLSNLAEHEMIQKLREIHTDSIDCIILYLAVGTADILLTMDDTLNNIINKNPNIQKWIEESNPNFRISVHDLSFLD